MESFQPDLKTGMTLAVLSCWGTIPIENEVEKIWVSGTEIEVIIFCKSQTEMPVISQVFFRLKQVCGIFNLGGTHGNFVKTKDWNVVVTFVIWWANRGINIIYDFGRDRGKKFIKMISQVIWIGYNSIVNYNIRDRGIFSDLLFRAVLISSQDFLLLLWLSLSSRS